MSNKILIITYYWPPAGGPGVQRWLKFIKYLPEYQIESFILTVDEKSASYPLIDKSLLNDISSELNVYKTKTKEIFSFYKRLTNKNQIPYSGFANEKKPSLIQILSRFIRGNFFIPDPRKAWNKYAYKKAVNIIKENNIKVVITTGPPHSTQLIGLKLKKKHKIKWIADFRDPWTDIYYYEKFYPTFIAKKIDRLLEKRVLIGANKIIVVSNSMKSHYIQKYNIKDQSIKVITNGYDEDDFSNIQTFPKDKFTITYTGTISDIYPMDTFIKSLEKLKELNLIINIVGNIHPSFINIIKQKQLDSFFNFVEHSSHDEALKYLFSSDIQLLLIPKTKFSKGIITGKLFEYMASGKPIICIGPENGDAAGAIRDTQTGSVSGFNDIKSLTKNIEYYYELYQKGKLDQKSKNIDKYSRKNLSEELSDVINELFT